MSPQPTPPAAAWWSPTTEEWFCADPREGETGFFPLVAFGTTKDLPADAVRLAPVDAMETDIIAANEGLGEALVEIGMNLGLPKPSAQIRWGSSAIISQIDQLRAERAAEREAHEVWLARVTRERDEAQRLYAEILADYGPIVDAAFAYARALLGATDTAAATPSQLQAEPEFAATDTAPAAEPARPGNHNALTITTFPKPVTGLCSCGALTEVEHEGQADTWWAEHRAAEGVTGWDDDPVELRTHCGCGRALPCRHCPEEP